MNTSIESEIASLRQRVDAAEARVASERRKGRVRSGLGAVALVAAFSIASAPQAAAQLGLTLASLASQVNTLANNVAALQSKTQYMSVNGKNTIFTGTNVVVDGGAGLGNVVVGSANSIDGTSSGNLVLGTNHTLTGVSRSLVGGRANTVSNGTGLVALGERNAVTDSSYASILGGTGNRILPTGADASSDFSAIMGGSSNRATGLYSTVVGGYEGNASGRWGSLLGGYGNLATGTLSTVSGGQGGTASGSQSSVGGGLNNIENRDFGWRASANLRNN